MLPTTGIQTAFFKKIEKKTKFIKTLTLIANNVCVITFTLYEKKV